MPKDVALVLQMDDANPDVHFKMCKRVERGPTVLLNLEKQEDLYLEYRTGCQEP